MSTAVGKSADEVLAIARQETAKGHAPNAGALYAAAASLASHAAFYHTGLEDAIQKEAQQVVPPSEFRQHPPFELKGSSEVFEIVRLSPISIEGKLYLVISHEVAPWKNSQEIEKKNRLLIKLFASRFPEYSETFAGLVAEATERTGNSGWRTVFDSSAI